MSLLKDYQLNIDTGEWEKKKDFNYYLENHMSANNIMKRAREFYDQTYPSTTPLYTPPENPLTVLARTNPNRAAGIMERKLTNDRIAIFANQEIEEKRENTKIVQSYFSGMSSEEKGRINAYDVETFEVREGGVLGFLGFGGSKKVTRVILHR
jgi:ABC-type glutathione transport system ATPase component